MTAPARAPVLGLFSLDDNSECRSTPRREQSAFDRVLRVRDTRYVAQAPGGNGVDRRQRILDAVVEDGGFVEVWTAASAKVSWTSRILSNSMKVGC
jgi:hypothetical protein